MKALLTLLCCHALLALATTLPAQVRKPCFITVVNDDDEPSPVGHEFQFVSSFLRKVAREDVCYETDSEAADSWAQADPVPHTRNDEARKTLGEILSRHTELVTAMNLEISDAAASFPPPPLNNSPKKA